MNTTGKSNGGKSVMNKTKIYLSYRVTMMSLQHKIFWISASFLVVTVSCGQRNSKPSVSDYNQQSINITDSAAEHSKTSVPDYNQQCDIPDSSHLKKSLSVTLVYDTPISGYEVSGTFYPFDAYCETGQVELQFKPLDGGPVLVFSNVGKTEEEGHPEWPQKFSGRNLDHYVFSGKFDGFHDGDTLHWHYYSTQSKWYMDSPLLYDAEFQFYDVDFDGQDEFLLNGNYKGQCGNKYIVYEIVGSSFVPKTGRPFDTITNDTRFYPSEKKIVDYLHDDDLYSYIISADGNSVVETKKIL